ncbi:MAG: polysaccharide deacetylase family protein [Bacteroidales bacterium]|jgi:peptidoglycan/xylan/chitin deacetylase (PgdA/CDA1 family)|nr:polysaccharide deacetylase family protein [Bacteroidales bacterium]
MSRKQQPFFDITKPQPPKIAEKVYMNVLWRLPQPQKTVYLTFDDGPVPQFTEYILDILEEYNIKGTFFCVGENIEKYPEIFKKLREKGHVVGSHTYNHIRGWRTNIYKYCKNIKKAALLAKSRLFRPPHGQIKILPAWFLSLKYRVVMWDVLSKDYDESISPEECFENVKNYVNNGSIIVFHDSEKAHKNLAYALPKTIEYLQSQGYKFATIPVK